MTITSRNMKETRTYRNNDGVKVVAAAKKEQIGAIVELNLRDGREGCVKLRYIQVLRVSVSFLQFILSTYFN